MKLDLDNSKALASYALTLEEGNGQPTSRENLEFVD